MKKFLFLSFVFLLTSATFGQKKKQMAYKEGEFIKFKIRYSFFNAAYATLKVNKTKYAGKDHYHVVGKGSSSGALRLFYKINDRYETYIDAANGNPSKFIRNINEGGYTKNKILLFNQDDNTVKVNDLKHKTTNSFKTVANVQDLISAFYHLRNQNTNSLKTGDYLNFNIFMDEETTQFKLKILGRETVNSDFGKINCIKIRPYVQKGRVFSGDESLTVWISDDENHLPIKIQAKLAVGSIYAELDEYKNLNNPLKFN